MRISCPRPPPPPRAGGPPPPRGDEMSGSILLGAVAALTETIEINCRACPRRWRLQDRQAAGGSRRRDADAGPPDPSLAHLKFPTLSISCELKKSRVALHPRRRGWLGTFSAPLRIPRKGPYGSGKSQWGLDNIMALQIIFQNTAAISAIFPEFVTVSSGKVLKMG